MHEIKKFDVVRTCDRLGAKKPLVATNATTQLADARGGVASISIGSFHQSIAHLFGKQAADKSVGTLSGVHHYILTTLDQKVVQKKHHRCHRKDQKHDDGVDDWPVGLG